ncbi:MAG: hypothetical protein AAFU80_19220 [Pseudomonadota bacterium]
MARGQPHRTIAATLRLALALAAGAFAFAGGAAAQEREAGASAQAQATDGSSQISLPPGAARTLARHAWAIGDMALARAIAEQLVAIDQNDAEALTLLAATDISRGDTRSGRRTAARAVRAAEAPTLRFDAAYVASSAAMAEGSYSAAQYWLRRAYQSAESDAQRDQIENAFRQVRAASPFHYRFSFDVAPSSNINGGSESEFLVIEDSPFIGVLSGTARALSGTRTSVTGQFGYDVARTDTARTTLGLQAYRSFNTLSEEAKDIAPEADGSDFDYQVLDFSITRRIAGPPGPLPDTYTLAWGRTWYGGEESDRVARIGLARRFNLSEDWSLRVGGKTERRLSDSGSADRFGNELTLSVAHLRPSGNILRLGLTGTDVASLDPNLEYTAYGLDAGLALGEPILGVSVSGHLGFTNRHYPVYSVGFIDVRDGRQDEVWDAALTFTFERMGVMGFVPQVSVTGEQSTSNVSRYEGETTGVSVGFRSAF